MTKKILRIALCVLFLFCGTANALELVRQKNVATYITFPIVDADGDFVTGATGLDSELDEFNDGGAPDGFADCTNEATEIGSTGIYYLSLANTEVDQEFTVIQVKTTSSGAKTQVILIHTMVGDPANAATSDDGGTINVTGGAIDTVTTATTATNLTNAPTNGDLTSTMKNSVATAVWNAATASYGSAGTYGLLIETDLDAAISSRSSHSAADVWSVATRLLTAGTNIALAKGTGITGFNDLSTSDIDARLVAIGLDHLISTSAAGTDIADNSIIAKMVSKSATADWDSFNNTTDSLEAMRDRGDASWITATGFSTLTAQQVWEYATRTLTAGAYAGLTSGDVDAIWDELVSGHTTASSFGKLLIDYLDVAVSSRSSHSAADVWAVGTRALTDKAGFSLTQAFPTNFSSLAITAGGAVTAGTVSDKTGYSISGTKTTLDALNDITAAGVWAAGTRTLTSGGYSGLTSADVDLIWDELQSGHSVAGSFGKYLDAQVSSVGGGSLTEAGIADAVWNETLADHVSAGSTGKKLSEMPTPYNVGP